MDCLLEAFGKQERVKLFKKCMCPFKRNVVVPLSVIPMILAGSSFWMPVGITIFGGGIGTLILVVTVLPVVYWKIYEKKTAKS